MTRFLLTTVITLSLIACGGTDDDGNISAPGLRYTGPTTPAIIDDNNANELTATVIGSVDAQQSSADENSLNTAFSQIGQALISNRSSSQQVVGAVQTELGSCGGSYTANYNSTNSSLAGSIVFSQYCMSIAPGDEITLDGAVNLSLILSTFEMEFEMLDLSITHAGETVSMNAVLSITTSSFTLIVRYVGPDGQVHQLADYSISGDPASGYTIAGSVYHPDYGYVTITTVSPLVYSNECMDGPISGELTLQGANGTTATIVINGCGDYQVTVDPVL